MTRNKKRKSNLDFLFKILRCLADSNCCRRFCRPLPSHSAKVPFCVLLCKGNAFFYSRKELQHLFNPFRSLKHQKSFFFGISSTRAAKRKNNIIHLRLLSLMLRSEQIIHSLDRIKRGEWHLDKHRKPITHRSIPKPRTLQRFQFATVF